MLRLFVRISHIARQAHLEDARGNNDQFKVDALTEVFCKLLGDVTGPCDGLAFSVQSGRFELNGLH